MFRTIGLARLPIIKGKVHVILLRVFLEALSVSKKSRDEMHAWKKPKHCCRKQILWLSREIKVAVPPAIDVRIDNATDSRLAALWDASRKREWDRKAHLEEAGP